MPHVRAMEWIMEARDRDMKPPSHRPTILPATVMYFPLKSRPPACLSPLYLGLAPSPAHSYPTYHVSNSSTKRMYLLTALSLILAYITTMVFRQLIRLLSYSNFTSASNEPAESPESPSAVVAGPIHTELGLDSSKSEPHIVPSVPSLPATTPNTETRTDASEYTSSVPSIINHSTQVSSPNENRGKIKSHSPSEAPQTLPPDMLRLEALYNIDFSQIDLSQIGPTPEQRARGARPLRRERIRYLDDVYPQYHLPYPGKMLVRHGTVNVDDWTRAYLSRVRH
ncbi:uncharacterized protein FOMMEDRAFT_161284 [Fomitiporia mediterranea MF3/22]|uniref:uncharacterized protein n=1 Tax=Fomitiporia mediterranea (strain MF3/22) TaxID=694068 RepID=UPI0004408554|nr:uncharacterized protein FOMMEDRAFT_161284 [Fomitiporia mediterranea MF3/22]EJC99057.1 hypothetical protein FOMMEDRAFT_161284 [Fomitiporia mediterranea MF3/22]